MAGSITCSTSESMCDSGDQCIPETWHCDGEQDCLDGSDESNCPVSSIICHPPNFVCDNKTICLTPDRLCDGVNQCQDQADEGGRCG